MYVLDYEYHQKRGVDLKEQFDEEWTEEKINQPPEWYQREKRGLSRNYERQALISEIKTERFIRNLKRLMTHYPNGRINSYPGELDNYIHLSIPIIISKNDIKSDILSDIYTLVESQYKGEER